MKSLDKKYTAIDMSLLEVGKLYPTRYDLEPSNLSYALCESYGDGKYRLMNIHDRDGSNIYYYDIWDWEIEDQKNVPHRTIFVEFYEPVGTMSICDNSVDYESQFKTICPEYFI